MARLSGVLIDNNQVVDYLRHEAKIKAVYQQILSRQSLLELRQNRE